MSLTRRQSLRLVAVSVAAVAAATAAGAAFHHPKAPAASFAEAPAQTGSETEAVDKSLDSAQPFAEIPGESVGTLEPAEHIFDEDKGTTVVAV